MDLEIKDLFRILAKRWWLIAAIVVAALGATTVYHSLYSKPAYVAGTKLIVTTLNHDGGLAIPDSNEISSNMMLIGTYKEIIASPAILEKVTVAHPEIGMDLGDLLSAVSVESNSGSQVINVTVKHSSYAEAVVAVNAIAQTFKTEIPEIMNVDNVTILSEARLSDEAVSISYGLGFKLAIVALLSLMCSVGIALLREYFDDTIKTEKDVLHFLGQPTLGTITRFSKSEIRTENKKKSRVGETLNGALNQQV